MIGDKVMISYRPMRPEWPVIRHSRQPTGCVHVLPPSLRNGAVSMRAYQVEQVRRLLAVQTKRTHQALRHRAQTVG
jgi:hypothetical protein